LAPQAVQNLVECLTTALPHCVQKAACGGGGGTSCGGGGTPSGGAYTGGGFSRGAAKKAL